MLSRFLVGAFVFFLCSGIRGSTPCPLALSEDYSLIRCTAYKSFIEKTPAQEDNFDIPRPVYVFKKKEIIYNLPAPLAKLILRFLPLEKKAQEKPSHMDLKNVDIIGLYGQMLTNKPVYCWVAFSEEAKDIRVKMRKNKQLLRIIFYRLLFKEKLILEDNLKDYSARSLRFEEGHKIKHFLEWKNCPFGKKYQFLHISAKNVKDIEPKKTQLSYFFREINQIEETSLIDIDMSTSDFLCTIRYKPQNLPNFEEIINLPALQKAWPYTCFFRDRDNYRNDFAKLIICNLVMDHEKSTIAICFKI